MTFRWDKVVPSVAESREYKDVLRENGVTQIDEEKG